MFHTQWGDKHFYIEGGGTKIFTWGGQTSYVGGVGGYDDVDKEMDLSEASKLSAGARILRGPKGPEILLLNISEGGIQQLKIIARGPLMSSDVVQLCCMTMCEVLRHRLKVPGVWGMDGGG